MKKILLITSRLPYPPIGGDKLKNYNLIKILSKRYEVHLVTITSEKLGDKSKEFLKKYTTTYKVFQKNKLELFFSLSKSLFNKEPLQVNYYYFKDVQNYINNVAKDKDLIISTLVRTTKYVINLNKPKIFDMADSIGQNYKKSIKKVKSPLWKLVYSIEADRLLNYEKKMINIFDSTFMFNKEEIKYFNNDKIKFLPHGVNEDLLEYEKINDKYKDYVAFFGKMDYQPNIDAVLWFVENVFNKLNKNIKFIIVGAKPTKQILNLTNKYKNIEVTGFVEDPYEILKSSLCVVAPMQTGAGIQNKILESMALGTINVVSSLAANPIGANHKKEFLVSDEPDEIANTINDIQKNKVKYEYLKSNAREFIRNNFTWTIYGNVYTNEIERLLNDSKK
ncbi:glycosyltransferase [Hippea maritima]|uniref:Glycosyl transferase group 1 n=1 Tax=Hippea maritima (strain ATCC 700847 / DSM 10411 / MH2) TaxID=760142 RepID=F2LUP6_HIPMA|nr:glycosyltransferase [Hippea maritima]AEA34636.1 glycosyl transferase group 1 [Hippea maritima DSM 10411]